MLKKVFIILFLAVLEVWIIIPAAGFEAAPNPGQVIQPTPQYSAQPEAHGKARLGVMIQDLTPEVAKGFGIDLTEGALIADLVAGGPGEQAGLQKGDIIRESNRKKITKAQDVISTIAEKRPGDVIVILVMRDKRNFYLSVKLDAMPAETAAMTPPGTQKAPTEQGDPDNSRFLRFFNKTAQPTTAKQPEATAASKVKSDIDELPAVKRNPDKQAYAIVIGIEKYRQNLPKSDYSIGDAQLVAEYLVRVLGYPEENIVVLTNEHATKSDFEKYFERWLSNNVEKGGSVFVYYSGHGAPNPQTGDAYLVPYDGDPSFIDQTGYSLKRMYDSLGKLPAKQIFVALDSCFSGAGGRSVLAKGARPLVMSAQRVQKPSVNTTVLAASDRNQISTTYEEKGHGLFTYFMLKGIKEECFVSQSGAIDFADLYSYIKPQVERIARKKYNAEQTPQLITPQPAKTGKVN